MKEMRLGGHLSAANGLRHVVVNARALGYNAVQIMVGGSREYKPYEITAKDARDFKETSFGIDLYVHLPYVINPCEDGPQRRAYYRHSFKQHVQAAVQLGARGVVIHPGYKKQLSEDRAHRNLLTFIEDSLAEDEGTYLLLETDAGSKNGSAVGSAELIAETIEVLEHPKVAMCLDTTHVYARGTDLWDKEIRQEFLSRFHRFIRLVHLNVPDLNVVLGGHLDRHNIPFEDRPEWSHEGLIKEMTERYPCILERRSLAVQEKDARYIREITAGDPKSS